MLTDWHVLLELYFFILHLDISAIKCVAKRLYIDKKWEFHLSGPLKVWSLSFVECSIQVHKGDKQPCICHRKLPKNVLNFII